ncbi:hypothetical protein JYG23_13375 [Sedimentibacter sp. zth1]|uniref:hypothetical protein n=1 Tax=Sedimentibacter sp. zth1 TaxID=2816908 RepID=UPI001A91AF51|nr:hypothetical protein [Sedimentibacter sp. zth1]QSX05641.1 hypothetical protein JYG23_13375 [Sedimentibacter sp. zth1]
MKLRKTISIVLVIAILALTGAPEVYAMPERGNGQDKGGIAPGLLKNMILNSDLSEEEAVELIIENAGSLSPGVLKEIILGLDLSSDSLEKLEEEGILDGLPGGILKEILSGDDEDDEEEEIEVKGNITDIDVEDKIIEIDGKEYELPEEVEIEIDGEKADLGDLEVGMEVELEIEDEEAKIKAESVEGIATIEGNIEGLDLIGTYHITIDKEEYKIAEEVEVILDAEEATLEDLEVGMEAKIEIIDEEVARIYAQSIGYEEVEGNIEDLDLIGTYHITIDEVEYKIAEEVEVILDAEEATLEDLEVGMEAKIEIIDEEVTRIYAQSIGYETIEGNIEDLDLIGTYHITIDEVEYKIAEEVEVILDAEEATLEDLEVGMEAKIEIIDEEVTRIYAQSIGYETIEGNIEDLDLIGTYHITIDEEEYKLSRDAQVVINGFASALEDLETGMSVVVKLQEEIVVKVNVEFEIEEIEGNITGIDLEDRYITIDEVEYKLANEVEIRLNNKEAILEDLELEMEINAVELYGEIVEINAFKEEILEAQGMISAINLEYGYVEIGGIEYQLATETIVKVDGEVATLEDLIVGMSVEVELCNGEIVKIYAEIIETSKIEGKITDLDLIGIYHLSVDDQEYNLLSKAIVTLNEEEAQLEDLQLGMSAIIYLVDNNIIKIEATMINSERVLGEIKDIDLIGVYHVRVGAKEYVLSKEAQVTIDEKEATLEDLEIGMEANVLVEDELVTKIDAKTSEVVKVQGLLTSINIEERNIEVNEAVYNLSDEVEVFIDEAGAVLTDLEVEMDVEIEIDNGLVEIINANSIEQSEVLEAQGILMGIDLEERTITIDEEQYDLADNMETITVNGVNSFLEDIVVNMNVEVEIQNNVVTKIAAEDNVEQITGEIIEVSFTTEGMKLTIDIVDGETAQHLVSKDLENNNSEILSLGYYAQFKVVNSIIVEVIEVVVEN